MENDSLKYIRRLDVEHIKQAMSQSHVLWGEGASLEERTSFLLKKLGLFGPDIFYMSGMISPSGELVSSMKRYYFDLLVDQKKVKAIGLGAIFTDPNKRGKGHGAELIKRVLEEANQKESCQAAFLYSDINPAFYQQFGFEAFPAQRWSLDPRQSTSGQILETREAQSTDLDQLLDWYELGWGAKKIRPCRNRETWSLFREINHLEPDRILINNYMPVGYFTYGWNAVQKTLILAECFVLKGNEQWAFNSVLKLSQYYQAEKIVGWGGSESLFSNLVRIEFRSNSVPMLKLFSEKILKKTNENDFYFGIADHF